MLKRLVIVAGCLLAASAALAETRVALLIGNGAYQNAARLPNPVNDTRLVAQTLRDAGFETVVTLADQDLRGMRNAIGDFEQKAAAADVALVFYSGHGIELNGENFLVPVDARLQSDRDVKFEALSLNDVLQAVSGARKLKLVMLDACRDNPFANQMKRSGSTRSATTRGLGRVEAPSSATLIAFAAAPGQVALDGDGSNSPFSTAIAKNLVQPGVDVRLALGGVHDDVVAATAGRQEPFLTGSLGRDPVFLGKPGAATPAKPVVAEPVPVQPVKPQVALAPPPPAAPPPAAPSAQPRSGGFIFPQSDRVPLRPADLQPLTPDELRIARNEIYARKGFMFDSADLRSYFAQFPWYRPTTNSVLLSPVEQANVALIKDVEKRGPGLATADPPAAAPSFIFADSDRRVLTYEELAGLDAATLRIARNEIVARRGRFFQDQSLTAYFSRFPWYRPTSWDPPLNAIEKRNMELIADVEKTR